MITAEAPRIVARTGRGGPGPELAALIGRYPPRPPETSWPATRYRRDEVLARLLTAPFAVEGRYSQAGRRAGLIKVLRWLEMHPGDTWQQRWLSSGADQLGNTAWRHLASRQLHDRDPGVAPRSEFLQFGRGLMPLLGGDVLRPSTRWLLTPQFLKCLPAEMARSRDPGGFARLADVCADDPANPQTKEAARRRIAAVLAAKGGSIADITVGDCLEIVSVLTSSRSGADTSAYLYQLLHSLGVFPPSAPATARMFTARGQLSIEQLVDRYQVAYRPVRDLLVAYLRERQPTMDYVSLRALSFGLCKMFWKDLEDHHPGIDSLRLPPEVATAWKQRVGLKTRTVKDPAGKPVEVIAARSDHGLGYLTMVRAFYLDIAQWAMQDPPFWGQWAAPCPIRDEDMSRRKERSSRKSRMDQRTRERLPALPALVAAADARRAFAAQRLQAARDTPAGESFTVDGQTLRRRALVAPERAAKVWADDPKSGERRDLILEEHRAFWTWATIEVLRHTGIRIEELTELTHHSLVQYRLPSSGELVPLLQIAPSKADAERLLVISPELADVLAAVICRVRGSSQALPLVVSYDTHERVWNPPMPLLFQRRVGVENRQINAGAIRRLLNTALADTGLTDASGQPLRYTPHDFRRIFITDAILNGMPPHIAQLIAGHRDIGTTLGYKAVYPEEVINGHRAFITRRRATRPGEEYRLPTDEEWDEFLGHFERRKVAHGTCGRAFGSPCIHEHACIRCPMLRPEPTQRRRLIEVRDNLRARIAEAEMEGWLGEIEGLRVSLAGADEKLAQADQLARRANVNLGMPSFADAAGRTVDRGQK